MGVEKGAFPAFRTVEVAVGIEDVRAAESLGRAEIIDGTDTRNPDDENQDQQHCGDYTRKYTQDFFHQSRFKSCKFTNSFS
jgi:hypothetical protein